MVCHHEQGPLETDLPVCSLAKPDGTIGKGHHGLSSPELTKEKEKTQCLLKERKGLDDTALILCQQLVML